MSDYTTNGGVRYWPASEQARARMCDGETTALGSLLSIANAQTQLLTEIRDFLKPQQPTNEQMALGIVKGVASELVSAADSLAQAAERLKGKSDTYGARLTMEASQRARRAAEGLIGG